MEEQQFPKQSAQQSISLHTPSEKLICLEAQRSIQNSPYFLFNSETKGNHGAVKSNPNI